MSKLSQIQISHYELYRNGYMPYPHGVLDKRLGISSKTEKCDTCGENTSVCSGHFGYIKLELPVFHIGYFKTTLFILQVICKVEKQKLFLNNSKFNLDYSILSLFYIFRHAVVFYLRTMIDYIVYGNQKNQWTQRKEHF